MGIRDASLKQQESMESDGFAFVRSAIDAHLIDRILGALATLESGTTEHNRSKNARGLAQRCAEVARLVESPLVRELVEPILGAQAFLVRGILFDKVEGANWHVGWHQDLMIPVAARVETAGFSAWSVKQGVAHVRPPADVLANMLTLRVHLDDCPAENGPLEVLPGTHRLGIVAESKVQSAIAHKTAAVCEAEAGDILLMRPLLFHSSKVAKVASHRRVVHLEFAGCELPGKLEWHRPSYH